MPGSWPETDTRLSCNPAHWPAAHLQYTAQHAGLQRRLLPLQRCKLRRTCRCRRCCRLLLLPLLPLLGRLVRSLHYLCRTTKKRSEECSTRLNRGGSALPPRWHFMLAPQQHREARREAALQLGRAARDHTTGRLSAPAPLSASPTSADHAPGLTQIREHGRLGLHEADCVERLKLEGPLLRPLAVCLAGRWTEQGL